MLPSVLTSFGSGTSQIVSTNHNRGSGFQMLILELGLEANKVRLVMMVSVVGSEIAARSG